MELIQTVKTHWEIHVILHTLHLLLQKVPQSTEETDSYCNGPSLGALESRNKIPPGANDTVVTPHLEK